MGEVGETREDDTGLDAGRRLLDLGVLRQKDVAEHLPETVGRYEILRSLGRGATSEVFLARDPTIDREVAVKVLMRRGGGLERFQQEMRVLAKIEHAGLVRILDAGVMGKRPYFVMEYIDGRLFEDADLDPRGTVEALEQVALACHAAHEQGVVHRDLKPANVVLRSDGRPVVADFGLAKLLDTMDGQGITTRGAALGTPLYMAPEQYEGKADRRSDVYSLGVMLYRGLTGRHPFEGDTMTSIVAKAISGEPLPPREIEPSVPEALERCVLRAIARDPADRYSTALELAQDLRAWLDAGAESKLRGYSIATVVSLALLLVIGIPLLTVLTAERLTPREQEALGELQRIEAWSQAPAPAGQPIPWRELQESLARLEPVLSEPKGSAQLRRMILGRQGAGRLWSGQLDAALAGEPGEREGAGRSLVRAEVHWDRFFLAELAGERARAARERIAADDEARRALSLAPAHEEKLRAKRLRVWLEDPAQAAAGLPASDPLRQGQLLLLAGRAGPARDAFGKAAALRPTAVRARVGQALAEVALAGEGEERAQRLIDALEPALDALALHPTDELAARGFTLVAHELLLTYCQAPLPRDDGPRHDAVQLQTEIEGLDSLLTPRPGEQRSPSLETAAGSAHCLLALKRIAESRTRPLAQLFEVPRLFQGAVESLEACAQQDPEHAAPRFGLALVHAAQAKLLAGFERVPLVRRRATVLRQEQVDASMRWLDAVGALEPDHPRAAVLRKVLVDR